MVREDSESSMAAIAVNVGTPSRTVFVTPVWVADRIGFYRDAGIALKLDIINNSEQIAAQVRSDALHISIDGPEASMLDSFNGGPHRVIAGNANKLPHFIIAQARYKKLADLKGANIGVLSLHEGTAKFIPRIMATAGLKPGDYKITQVGGAPTRWKLLQDGKIDVGMQPFPLSYQAEAAGFSNLGWTGDYEPDWQFTAVNANSVWARDNKDAVIAFLAATLRGWQYAMTALDDAAAIAAEELQTTVPFAKRAIEEMVGRRIFDPKLNWSDAGLAAIYHNLQEDGAVPADAKFGVARFADAGYLREAQRTVAGAG
jgi:ABC-type nitrate/sulfonate/bicarbonate transport system substrate-binding protein